jgi:trimeric autotransporter adhesin
MKNFVRVSIAVLALSVAMVPAIVRAQTITTVAGGGPPTTVTGLLKTGASVGAPAAVRQDSLGNTYILDNDFSRVYKVDTTGHLTLFAGNGAVGFSGEGSLATNAAMFEPSGMCIDVNNNVYVADSDNAIIREIVVSNPTAGQTVGHIYTVAGVETETNFTYGGDGGLATAANLHFPDGCSFDSHGNMFIADRGNNAIRVVIGTANVPPTGLTGTTAGHIYLYTGSTPTGGNPPAAGASANGTATVGAALNGPFDVFVDSSNNLFIADLGNPGTTANNIIREVPASAQTSPFAMIAGDIYTVAGVQGQNGLPVSGVSALTAKLNGPEGLFVDAHGNLFFCDNSNEVVREVAGPTPGTGMVTGDIYTIAGNGGAGYAGDGGVAVSASFTHPAGLFVDSTGSVFVADSVNDRVRQISINTGNYLTETISTWAGNGSTSFSDGTPATAAQLNSPAGLAIDTAGNLAIADEGASGDTQSLIRKVATPISTGALTTIAGEAGFNGFVNTSPFVENNAIGVAYDASGNLYIADTGNCIIRELSAGVMTTVAGTSPTLDVNNPPNSTPNCGFTAAGGAAVGTLLGAVNSVALDAAGDIFFSDATNNVIWEVPKTTVGNLTAGDAYIVVGTQDTTGSFGGEGGVATAAHLKKPTGIAFDIYGNLYIADTGNNIIREVPIDNTGAMTAGNIYTVAGDKAGQTAGYSGNNGVATSAQLNAPFTIAVDNADDIFIADTNNHVIREVAGKTAGGKTAGDIYLVAGNHTEGFAGDGGVATAAELDFPQGLALDGAGDLLISDSQNNRVRSIAAIGNEAPVPTASFDKSSLTFTAQPVNIASTPQAVTLTNNGTAALSGIAITLGGADAAFFSLAPTGTCTASLPAGQNCIINVTFTPTAVRTFNASISIADNAVGSPQTITLTGTGQTGVPTDAMTPSPLAFTPQPVGVPSAALPVIVSNATGTGPLVITGVTFGGTNGSDFSQTNTCGTLPATVAIGATCTINVVFNPTSGTPAARSATLTLADNAANTSINITGTATVATVSFSPTNLTFASQAVGTKWASQAITVKNTGTAALAFSSISIAGPNKADFSLTPAATCSTTTPLAPGPTATCAISVTYAPAAAGTSTAMVIVADNATGGSQTIDLTGTATPAALSLNLGAASGGSTSQTVTAGMTASYSLQISANQNASVTFTCSGAPTAAVCSVPTTAVAVTAGTPAAVAVTVTTTARGLLMPQSQPATRMQPPAAIQMLPLSVLAMLLLIATLLATTQSPAGRLRVARVALSACLVLMPIAAATLLVGCGGGSGSTTPPPVTGTPAGTYTVVVTATSGSQTATTNLTLIVQ